MKRLLPLLWILLAVYTAGAQHVRLMNDHSPMVRRMMELYHCCPPDRNVMNHRILETLSQELDPGHLILSARDVDTIMSSGLMLDAELDGRNSDFISKVMALYKLRVRAADSLLDVILGRPLDLRVQGTALARDTTLATDRAALYQRLQTRVKLSCLYRLGNMALSDSTATGTSILKNLPQVQEKVLRTEHRQLRRLISQPADYEEMMLTELYDAICKSFDPHSDFFTSERRQKFVGVVTGEHMRYGFTVDENDAGEPYISAIDPGSAAWRSGELNAGDVITALHWQGEEPVDLLGADDDEVEELLHNHTQDKVDLTVRKSDGTIKTVKLQKSKVQDEESMVRSYVLDGTPRVGYIVLPGFYSNWENKGGKTCGDDVAKEVIKLKGEHVDAIILDLRYNGGGSMQEAMALAGIFIDEGAMVSLRANKGKVRSLPDPNRGTIYDGPLLVMVNHSSASASELVAGVLQDYHRAIIAGSPTYGKATMQVVLPVDTSLDLTTATEKTLGAGTEFIKVTDGRIYRVTGRSNQLNGVLPDIHLPDLTESVPYGEATEHYALMPDTVRRATYFTPLAPLPIPALSAAAEARVRTGAAWHMEDSLILFQSRQYSPSLSVPLEINAYISMVRLMRNKSAALKKATAPDAPYKPAYMLADMEHVRAEYDSDTERNKPLEKIGHDLYLQECFSIIADYLNNQKK